MKAGSMRVQGVMAHTTAKYRVAKRNSATSQTGRTKIESTHGKSRTDPTVGNFLRDLDHPLKKDIEAVRRIILAASPRIREGIKWNSLSFRTADAVYFATVNRRCREAVQLVFHKGAKVKDNTTTVKISDPKGLIKWISTDRCLVTLGTGKDIRANRAALATVVREWIKQM